MVSNSVSESCDENGTCSCQSGATGRTCNQCALNYFQSDEGCVCKLLKLICYTFNDYVKCFQPALIAMKNFNKIFCK